MINAHYDPVRHVLRLTADNESRTELADAYALGGYPRAESLVAEGLHEAYEFFPPENIPGALTDAPILVDCDHIGYPDSGDRIAYDGALIFWFPDYMVTDPFELLKNRGYVEFPEATPHASDMPRPAPYTREFIESHLPGGDREGVAIWIGNWSFPESWSYDDVLSEYPFLCRSAKYEPDSWDVGLYFWQGGDRNDPEGGKRHGPYNGGAEGCYKVERDGGTFREREPDNHPDQLELI